MTRVDAIRLKVKRAKHHINEFNGRIHLFFTGGSDPYPVIREDDPQTGDLVFKLGKCQSIPEDFPTIVGDILQNLRTALDHLAWQLVLANGKQPKDGVTGFPIAETAKKYEAMYERKVEGMCQKAIDRICALKPYDGGNDDLWGLHELNNSDKHRLLFVVGAAHIGVTIDVAKGFPPGFLPPGYSQHVLLKPSDYAWPLKDGTELFRIFKAVRASREFDDNPQFTFQVAFGNSEVMEGQPILPPLTQLADYIDSVILSFPDLLV